MENFNMKLMREMMSSRMQNYIVPGLASSLVAEDGKGANGRVRIFEASRQQLQPITPHSHRFSFQCLVLQGSVWNMRWERDPYGDEYAMSSLFYQGAPGEYTKRQGGVDLWSEREEFYREGEWYGMAAHEIHSIEFSKDAVVLFFEGVSYMNTTEILEPVVDGEIIPTFKVEPWMFKKEGTQ